MILHELKIEFTKKGEQNLDLANWGYYTDALLTLNSMNEVVETLMMKARNNLICWSWVQAKLERKQQSNSASDEEKSGLPKLYLSVRMNYDLSLLKAIALQAL